MKVRSVLMSSAIVALLIAPVSTAAAGERAPRTDITIEWNGEFDRAHGVRSGNGTVDDPYVISGWEIANLTIRDTDKAVKIVDNTITGRLTLDYIGSAVVVRNNDIADLRVNRNVARWGDTTTGRIVKNRIGVVGQLRHFDGLFARNVVGAPEVTPAGTTYPDTRALNLDGFNGAHFMENTIYGYVDARLHGHHHSSEFGGSSHRHASGGHAMHGVDHTDRYHEVFLHDNEIFTSHTYGLAYLDTNHAANDRTANSETNPMLNAPHVHHTRAHIMGNELTGAGILVNVFNAQDPRHERLAHGLLRIAGNEVSVGWDPLHPVRELSGIEVRNARHLSLKIVSNRVLGDEPMLEQLRLLQVRGTGLKLDGIDRAHVLIKDLTVTNRRVGIHAARMTSSVLWEIDGFRTSGVQERIVTDDSVKNEPTTG